MLTFWGILRFSNFYSRDPCGGSGRVVVVVIAVVVSVVVVGIVVAIVGVVVGVATRVIDGGRESGLGLSPSIQLLLQHVSSLYRHQMTLSVSLVTEMSGSSDSISLSMRSDSAYNKGDSASPESPVVKEVHL
ncbi:hypothetical protein Tco_1203235 [Tanacetum coccineum]